MFATQAVTQLATQLVGFLNEPPRSAREVEWRFGRGPGKAPAATQAAAYAANYDVRLARFAHRSLAQYLALRADVGRALRLDGQRRLLYVYDLFVRHVGAGHEYPWFTPLLACINLDLEKREVKLGYTQFRSVEALVAVLLAELENPAHCVSIKPCQAADCDRFTLRLPRAGRPPKVCRACASRYGHKKRIRNNPETRLTKERHR
jgi:hypothetical protein